MKELFLYLRQIGPLSKALEMRLEQVLECRKYAKGEILLRVGSVNDKAWFLEKGVVKWVRRFEHSEVVTWFNLSGTVIYEPYSFNKQTACEETAVAVEDCSTFYITREELYLLYEEFPETKDMERKIKDEHFKVRSEHCLVKSLSSMEDRYRYLSERFGGLVYGVDDGSLASFLNMSERSFRNLKNGRRVLEGRQA